MKLYRLFDIKWDTDGIEVELPSEHRILVEDDFDVDTEGADKLSDEFGFLVVSFEVEELSLATL